MDTRDVTLICLKSALMQLHLKAQARYSDEVMDYLTPKKLTQLTEVIINDELARRQQWAEFDDIILEECIEEVMARAPWHKGDHQLLEDIRTFVYEPLQQTLYRMLDDYGISDPTLCVWHAEPRPNNEYLLINEGDYRIHVWNRLAKNHRRQDGLQWWFDQGLYGFRIAKAWHLPGHGGAMALDHSGSAGSDLKGNE